ncbi:MAG: DNA repair protein RecN [Candidatus Competibacterales bacterium]
MLRHLHIRDYAIARHIDLDLTAGMLAMTGETGAGKSIMIDALALLLGDRADPEAVWPGAPFAEVSAHFDLDDLPAARAWLAEQRLVGEVCRVRRIVPKRGRSRAYINDTPQPIAALKALGEHLVDIHGQHAHQALVRREAQRQLLDAYLGLQDSLAAVGQHYRQWRDLRHTRESLAKNRQVREERTALLRYQLDELDALDLKVDELPALEAEHRRLANAEALLASCQQLLTALQDDDDAAATRLHRSQQTLAELTALDETLAPVGELLDGALIQLQEACSEIGRYAQDVELDPERLHFVEQRLGEVERLARKHRTTGEELPALRQVLQREFADLSGRDSRQQSLEAEEQAAFAAFEAAANALAEARRQGALTLGERVTRVMGELGMAKGRFEVWVKPTKPSETGIDAVEFAVSANPGQPLRPLAKVASGGELSRISLAIQVITAECSHVPTLVFDEVDSGIGGGIAEAVGQKLRTLGERHQELCVTHLPQVAAQAHGHWRIEKQVVGEHTQTAVVPLDRDARVREIARMLGGLKVTSNTLNHAREMLELAQGTPASTAGTAPAPEASPSGRY